MTIRAHGNFVLVTDLEQGRKKTKGGILLPDIDTMKEDKKPRWAKVHSIGPRSIVKDDIKQGDWICITFLRWTNGFNVDDTRMWAVEDKSILMMSDTKPEELHEAVN
jgi:co-chaperonin GroES (HSP10)